MTSLQLAVALSEHAPCAESLIKAGADPSLKNAVSYRWLGSGLGLGLGVWAGGGTKPAPVSAQNTHLRPPVAVTGW